MNVFQTCSTQIQHSNGPIVQGQQIGQLLGQFRAIAQNVSAQIERLQLEAMSSLCAIPILRLCALLGQPNAMMEAMQKHQSGLLVECAFGEGK